MFFLYVLNSFFINRQWEPHEDLCTASQLHDAHPLWCGSWLRDAYVFGNGSSWSKRLGFLTSRLDIANTPILLDCPHEEPKHSAHRHRYFFLGYLEAILVSCCLQRTAPKQIDALSFSQQGCRYRRAHTHKDRKLIERNRERHLLIALIEYLAGIKEIHPLSCGK